MPLYEYTCRKCEHTFEALVSAQAPRTAVACPKCESDEVGSASSGCPRAGRVADGPARNELSRRRPAVRRPVVRTKELTLAPVSSNDVVTTFVRVSNSVRTRLFGKKN